MTMEDPVPPEILVGVSSKLPETKDGLLGFWPEEMCLPSIFCLVGFQASDLKEPVIMFFEITFRSTHFT